MTGWKADAKKPKTRFCWDCSKQLHGRVHARVVEEDGAEHDVHKRCVNGRRIVDQSGTRKT